MVHVHCGGSYLIMFTVVVHISSWFVAQLVHVHCSVVLNLSKLTYSISFNVQ